MAKKVLIFSTSYLPFVGGAEIAIKETTSRIDDFHFDLITAKLDPSLKKEEKIGNVNVYRIGFGLPLVDKLLIPFLGAFKVFDLNRKNNYDIFWCVMATFASGAAYIFNILHFWKKIPILLNLQEGDSEDRFKGRWFGLIDFSWRAALKRTSYLTVLSNYLKERAFRLGYKGKCQIVPMGVDLHKFKPEISEAGIAERKDLRKKWRVQNTDVCLITASRLVVKNGIGDVIEAMPLLPSNVKFVICGSGNLENELKRKAEDLKVSDKVIFLGEVFHDDLPGILRASDIFIRPSLSEGFGVSFIEAMAARLPVIATAVGGIPEFIEDPASPAQSRIHETGLQTGYFCEPRNPESITKTVERVINDVGTNRVIDNAYKMVKERYDWEIITSQMKEVFNKIEQKE